MKIKGVKLEFSPLWFTAVAFGLMGTILLNVAYEPKQFALAAIAISFSFTMLLTDIVDKRFKALKQ